MLRSTRKRIVGNIFTVKILLKRRKATAATSTAATSAATASAAAVSAIAKQAMKPTGHTVKAKIHSGAAISCAPSSMFAGYPIQLTYESEAGVTYSSACGTPIRVVTRASANPLCEQPKDFTAHSTSGLRRSPSAYSLCMR